MNMPTLQERYLGAMLGLACGDAVGTSVEFSARGSFAPVTGMRGGGPFGLAPGQWTDDTSMALCLAESLIYKRAFDAHDQMTRYLNWWRWGYLSSTGNCFDIGMTVREALFRFEKEGIVYAGSSDPYSAGNGSLMRLAPVVLYAYPDKHAMLTLCAESSRTTHGAAEAIECCQLFGSLLGAVLDGLPLENLLTSLSFTPQQPRVRLIGEGSFMDKSIDQIRGSGYCVESLEAALWCLMHTDSLSAAVLAAANLGDDADTTAAIVGQIAGAYYGVQGIPRDWLNLLALRADIENIALLLLKIASETTVRAV